MNLDAKSIQKSVKNYLLKAFLPGEDPDSLTPDTPLISGGILDSISVVKLVNFLEEQYKVEFQAHEINSETLETLTDIARTILIKSAARE